MLQKRWSGDDEVGWHSDCFADFHQVGPVERQLIALNAPNRHHGTTDPPRIL